MSKSITFRPGVVADTRAVYDIFQESVTDLGRRLGVQAITSGEDPDVMASLWERRRPLFEHLTQTGDQFWVAEEAGQPIGYARAILRDGIRELTEFFVLPGRQSAGVGRELLARVFPSDGARHKVIIATTDARAQARYLKAGVYARFPIYYFSRPPERVSVANDLEMIPITATPETLVALAEIDAVVVGHRRDEDHAWLLQQRQGILYRRNGRSVGYGYLGYYNGPFALLHEEDFPAVLAHAESDAAENGRSFGVELPLINRVAVDYLLARGYRMDSFFAFFMSDAPFGRLEQYIFPSPPFFM